MYKAAFTEPPWDVSLTEKNIADCLPTTPWVVISVPGSATELWVIVCVVLCTLGSLLPAASDCDVVRRLAFFLFLFG